MADDTPAPAAASPNVVVVQSPSAPAAQNNFQLEQPKKTKRVWYGWQTLTMDGVAVMSGGILAKAGYDNAGWVWVGTYAFGPPVVHALHGHVGIAFADLGIRVVLPTLTTLAGAAIGCSGGSNDDDGFGNLASCVTGVAVGFLVGYAGAIAVDAAVLARETVPVDPNTDDAKEIRKQEAKRASTFSVMPDFGVGQNKATFGLHGQF